MVNRTIEQGALQMLKMCREALCGGGMGDIPQDMSSPPFTSHGSVVDSMFSSMERVQRSPMFRVGYKDGL